MKIDANPIVDTITKDLRLGEKDFGEMFPFSI